MQTEKTSDTAERVLQFRKEIYKTDGDQIRDVTNSTGFFNQEEVDIAVELVNERLEKGESSGYYFWFADLKDRMVGYACFGPIAGTKSSFDLFWVVVRDDMRGLKIGKKLLEFCVATVKEMGGTRLYIETSSRELYIPTRQFYLNNQCYEEARLRDFYAEGDDKVIYVKEISLAEEGGNF